MTLIDVFPKDPSLEPAPDPLRLLSKKLRTLIHVYQAAVESGLVKPKGQEEEPDNQGAAGAADHGVLSVSAGREVGDGDGV